MEEATMEEATMEEATMEREPSAPVAPPMALPQPLPQPAPASASAVASASCEGSTPAEAADAAAPAGARRRGAPAQDGSKGGKLPKWMRDLTEESAISAWNVGPGTCATPTGQLQPTNGQAAGSHCPRASRACCAMHTASRGVLWPLPPLLPGWLRPAHCPARCRARRTLPLALLLRIA